MYYFRAKRIALRKYQSQANYQLDKEYLAKINIVITEDTLRYPSSTCNVIFQFVEQNVLKKLNLSPPTNIFMSCANWYGDKYGKVNSYGPIESFYQLIKCILKKESLTKHLKPRHHYVIFMSNINNNSPFKNFNKMKSFQVPTQYKSAVAYYLYRNILGNFRKINSQEKYNSLFEENKKLFYLHRWQNMAIVKGKCFNNEKSVLEIDKIFFILEYIDDEIDDYIESLPVGDVVKEYLFSICKDEYYRMCLCFLSSYIEKKQSVEKYKSLSDIKYKSQHKATT